MDDKKILVYCDEVNLLKTQPERAEIVVSEGGHLPTRGYPTDAGYDLFVSKDVWLDPHTFTDVPTGVSIKMPECMWARITGRSSTVRRLHIQVQEGIIDESYTGELYIGAWNLTDKPIYVAKGDRIAQLIFHYRVDVFWVETKELPVTERGSRGFGSTGK